MPVHPIFMYTISGGVAFRALASTEGESLLMLTKEPASAWVREEALAAVEQVRERFLRGGLVVLVSLF